MVKNEEIEELEKKIWNKRLENLEEIEELEKKLLKLYNLEYINTKADETIAWIVDLALIDDYRVTDAKFFHTEEEARRFEDAISDPKFDSNGWVAVNCYSITTSNMQSAYDALQQYDE